MRIEREHGEQCIVISWCELNKEKYPCLGRIYSIPNMGKHHVSFRVKQANEGLKKGMLDLCLPFPTLENNVSAIEWNPDGTNNFTPYEGPIYTCCGLYIEMKIRPNGMSDEQKEWKEYFISKGYACFVAWSSDEAIEMIKNHVNPEETNWRDFFGK